MKKNIAESEWQALSEAKSADRPRAFVKYARTVIAAHAKDQLKIQDAAYKICGAIFFDELDDIPELEQAINLACDLELPPAHQSSKDEQADWRKLTQLVSD